MHALPAFLALVLVALCAVPGAAVAAADEAAAQTAPAGASPAAGASADSSAGARFAAQAADLFGVEAVPERFRNEDAVILFAGDYVILHDDGRIDHGIHRVVLLDTEYAIGRYGDPRVAYDSLRQEVVVHTCRTLTPDGRTVNATAHALNRVTADEAAGCPDALSMQELVLSHVGVERGCVVEWDVEIRDRVPRAPWLEGTLFFPDDDPVVRRVISVKAPASAPWRARVVNGAIEPETVAAPANGGEAPATIRVWRAENLPAVRESDDGCGGRLARTHLLFTTCPDWSALCNRVLEDMQAAGRENDAMRLWAEEMRARPEVMTEEDQARAIAAVTSGEVRRASMGGFAHYLPPRPAARTFATGCGSVWDRAALALALLDADDMTARIALTPASREPDEDLPMLGQFDGVLLAPRRADENGAIYFIDPLSGGVLAEGEALARRPLFVLGAVNEASPGWCRAQADAREGRAEIAVSLVQDEGRHFHGSVDMDLSGALRPEGLDDLETFVADYADRLVPGAKPVATHALEITPGSARVRFDFDVAALGADRDGFTRLHAAGGPVAPDATFAPYRLHRPERTSALFLPGTISESVTWRLQLNGDDVAVTLPAADSLANEAGSYVLLCGKEAPAPTSGAERKRTIAIEWRLRIPSDTIPPQDVPALRRLLRAYDAESGRLIVLKP